MAGRMLSASRHGYRVAGQLFDKQLYSNSSFYKASSVGSIRFKTAPAPSTQNLEITDKNVVEDIVELERFSDHAAKLTSVEDDPKKLSFRDPLVAYNSKTTWEIFRAVTVLKLCQFDFLVQHNKAVLSISRKLLGKKIFEAVMKASFYGHFVAGEDQPAIKPLVERLGRYGVGAILDYSVEDDIPHSKAVEAEMDSCTSQTEETQAAASVSPTSPDNEEKHLKQFTFHREFGDRREGVSSARTYFYTDEKKCDDNLETLLNCTKVAGETSDDGFAAIKLTALGRPQILLNLSEVITRTRQMFVKMAAIDVEEEDLMAHRLTKQQFTSQLESMGITSRDESGEWFTWIDVDKDGWIDLLDWDGLVQPDLKLSKILKAPRLEGDHLELLQFTLTEEEEAQMKRMLQRINELAKCARDKNVRLMVDAEQTYFQPAISRLTMEMMRKFNRNKPTIFNTYQCYLKQAYNNLSVDMELARREGFHFGAKLVRGAYMDQERKRAADVGYDDPINVSYEATNASYMRCLNMALNAIHEQGNMNMMVASHNEDTIRHTVQRMKELGIGSRDRLVYFGQLLGMCDQVSFPLGQKGYAVYKYIPYGPVKDVLPYLSRRAQENSGMLKGVTNERKLLWRELKRRVKSGQILHTP